MANTYEIRYTDRGDFFDNYPDFLALKEVQDIFAYRGKGDQGYTRHDVSRMMWAVYFVYHFNSIWAKKPFAVRTEFVSNDFIGKKGWWQKFYPFLEPFIKKYNQLLDDAPERYLQNLYDKLDERNEMIMSIPYKIFDDKGVEIKGAKSNAEWLDKMILNSSDLVNEVRRVEATLHKTNDRVIKGGKSLTLHGKEELNGVNNEKSGFMEKALREAQREVS